MERGGQEGARLLRGVPRAGRGVVEDFARGGVGGEGGVAISLRYGLLASQVAKFEMDIQTVKPGNSPGILQIKNP